MSVDAFVRIARTIVLVASFVALAARGGEAASPAGVIITNTAIAQYADPKGQTYGAQSNTVQVAIAAVSAIVVGPKEKAVNAAAEGYPVGTAITRTFTITNAGNVPDAYTITAVTVGGGTISSIAFVTAQGNLPVTVGSTVSPTLQSGASISVQVVLATKGVAVGTIFPIDLSARSTNTSAANGLVSDNGQEWAVAQAVASLAGTSGPGTLVTKLVNATRATTANPGATITYSIAFENYGGSAATNVVLTDEIPVGITAQPQSLTLNGTSDAAAATLSGQLLTVKVGTLAAGANDVVTFSATVMNAETTGASFVNIASVTADGLSSVQTSPASVLVGLANIVYDGYTGGSAPIGGATITLRDALTHAIVALPADPGGAATAGLRGPQEGLLGIPAGGLTPNNVNANPYTTGATGAYSFVFTTAQLGTVAQPAQYELDITAPNYTPRRIAVTIHPDASGMLYDATLRDLDDQQLAAPGAFTLVSTSVSLSDIFGLLGNLPMFTPHPLTVAKTVDRDVASGGDRLVYTLQFGSAGAQFGTTRVIDTLPAGVVYAPGTARLDGVPAEPVRNGRILTWTLPSLTVQHTIVYACVVMPYAAEGATLVNLVDVDALAPSGVQVQESATADTRVVAGALGTRSVITGRVFVDAAQTGRFRPGDRGVGGVRIYLEDGESVTTDPFGRFTFPSVRPGQHVLRVDTTTLPPSVRPYDDRRYDSTRSLQRLLHGIYDAGLMQDVEFALEPAA
jgi:uncharacterized repeat protein (TIGR01451 family)